MISFVINKWYFKANQKKNGMFLRAIGGKEKKVKEYIDNEITV